MKVYFFLFSLILFSSCKKEEITKGNFKIYPLVSVDEYYDQNELQRLQVKDQRGEDIQYDKGIEIGWVETYESIFEFNFPLGISSENITSFNLTFNFFNNQDPNLPFSIFLESNDGSWEEVANTLAREKGKWTYFRKGVQNPEKFILDSQIRVKIKSNGGEAILDYFAIELNPTSNLTLPVSQPVSSGKWFRPWPGMKWGIQYTGDFSKLPDVEVFNIDLFETDSETIQMLKDRRIYVVCYFSGGSSEDWRPDFEDFPSKVKGKGLDGWPGEKWLDVREVDILARIMGKRMDIAVEKGCDAIDVDNMDGFTNDTGFSLSYEDQLVYNKTIASEAHKRNLGVGLKNDLIQIEDLVDDFDFAVNEQCFKYQECHHLFPFIEKGKPVWGIEYKIKASEFCEQSVEWGFDTIQKKLELNEWVRTCY